MQIKSACADPLEPALTKHIRNPHSPVKTRFVPVLITLLCAAALSLQSVHAATATVMNSNESGMGSLRQALAIATNPKTTPL
jgi:hypothetical protein